MLGLAATEREDWSGALPFFEASLDAFRRLGDDHYVLLAMDGIAWIARMLGDREGGKRLHEETPAGARASGDNGVVALQLWQLAGLANKEGRTGEALAMLREALVLNRDEGIAKASPRCWSAWPARFSPSAHPQRRSRCSLPPHDCATRSGAEPAGSATPSNACAGVCAIPSGTLPSSPLGSGAACSPQTRQSHSRS